MNDEKQVQTRPAGSRWNRFEGIFTSGGVRILVFALVGMTSVVLQRAWGSQMNETPTPEATPTPTETVVAASPTPTPLESVVAASPAPSPSKPEATKVDVPSQSESQTPPSQPQMDPKLVGNWEINDNETKSEESIRWEIQANGAYRLLAGSERKSGKLTTSDGKIQLHIELTSQPLELAYKVDDNQLTTMAPDGTKMVWRLAKNEPPKPRVAHRHHQAPPPHSFVRDVFYRMKKFFGFTDR